MMAEAARVSTAPPITHASSNSTPTPSSSVRGAIASRKRSCRVSGGSGASCPVVVTSIPSLPGADAGLVALGVGEHPKGRRRIVAEQRAAGGEHGFDPRRCLLGRHVDVDVDAIALRPRRIHL